LLRQSSSDGLRNVGGRLPAIKLRCTRPFALHRLATRTVLASTPVFPLAQVEA